MTKLEVFMSLLEEWRGHESSIIGEWGMGSAEEEAEADERMAEWTRTYLQSPE